MKTLLCLVILFQSAALGVAAPATQFSASGRNGAVAAGNAASVATGLEILQRGGNAADAAVAAMLVQTVVESRVFCFSGEVVALAHRASDRSTEMIAGVGEAPALATREYFAARGGIPGARSPETAAVPGALGAFVTLLERQGTMTFTEVSAASLALLDRHAEPWQAAMARTLRLLIAAEQGAASRKEGLAKVADCFYRGQVAREIDAWSRKSGGLLRYEDFAAHTTIVEAPLAIEYRGRTVLKGGPWCQGPVLLQTLRLLDGLEFRPLDPLKPDYIHLVAEALKLSLADRDAYYGDPRFVSVPLKALLSPEYAAERRKLIDPKKASAVWNPGRPLPELPAPMVPPTVKRVTDKIGDTTVCMTADRHGNVIVVTPSGWGGVVAGETGVILASRLRSFNTWAGHPNCIAPGKRPRITLSPTLVLFQGKPVLGVSVEGGDWQDQTSLQVVLDSLVFDMAPADAVASPRWGTRHHIRSFDGAPFFPASLILTPRFDQKIAEELRRRGHRIEAEGEIVGNPAAMRINADGQIDIAADPYRTHHVGAY